MVYMCQTMGFTSIPFDTGGAIDPFLFLRAQIEEGRGGVEPTVTWYCFKDGVSSGIDQTGSIPHCFWADFFFFFDKRPRMI